MGIVRGNSQVGNYLGCNFPGGNYPGEIFPSPYLTRHRLGDLLWNYDNGVELMSSFFSVAQMFIKQRKALHDKVHDIDSNLLAENEDIIIRSFLIRKKNLNKLINNKRFPSFSRNFPWVANWTLDSAINKWPMTYGLWRKSGSKRENHKQT